MATISDIHDPLTINLRRQTRTLLSTIPASSRHSNDLLNASSTSELLTILSRLLAQPAFTLTIAALFRPILFDLCARWLGDEQNTEEQLVALCLLVEVHEELFPILYRLLNTPTFSEGPLAFITASLSLLSIDVSRIQRLLLAHYRILRANRELPHLLFWPLSPLSNLIWTPHLDNGVRLLAIRCYALQSGMGEAERGVMEREVLGETCGVDCQMDFGQGLDGTRTEVDGWIMPVLELRRVQDAREEIIEKSHDYYHVEEGEIFSPTHSSDLSPHVVNVHGIFLLRASGYPHTSTSPLISTPTTVRALQSLAIHLSLRLPTLLTSPPSSGKSLFLSHLAELLHPGVKNQIITIHLADTSLDPRALLGSYASSPTQPGTFEWKEGVLVRSMREGKWVVFEDIDRGSSEVLGVIKPLVESLRLGKWVGGRASLQIPSRGRVVAHNNFSLFATRSTLPSRMGTFPSPVFFGAHKFHEVIIPAPSPTELQTILDSRFPRLAGSATLALVRLWETAKAVAPAASSREIGLRELEKFCTRVQRLLPSSYQSMDVDSDELGTYTSLASIFPNPTLREDMYLEARDIFFGAGTLTASSRAHTEAIASVIAEHLGLEPDRRAWVLNGRIPDFDLEKDVNGSVIGVHIGRTHLPARTTKMEIAPPVMRPFAMHRPAVLLLSRIATAVSLSEPVLLTGETGTGKTSVVTYLASRLRRPLISLNLSHQTESSDLLGGFKPVDARIPGAALQQRFLDLFGGTFSRRKNEKFEVEVRKAVAEGKWKRAVGLWKESSRLARDRIQAKGVTDSSKENKEMAREMEAETPRKRRKVDQTGFNVSDDSWAVFVRDVEEFEVQHVHGKGKFAFGFVEGPLVKALRSGDWVLLDEINLASPETLECISGLLHGPTASITLTEQGSLEPVPRHPDFRLFACMNPATDVGKKDLPPNIRSRFTEIDVPPPDADKETLLSIVSQYIGSNAVGDKGAIMNVAEFYAAVKDLAEKRQIADGSNHRPHYSMRTLARALTFASDTASMFGLRRAIWEGCLMAFTMVLDAASAELVLALAQKHLLAGVRNPRSMLTKEPQVPHTRSIDEFVKFGPFYLERGPIPEDPVEDYIMTPSVETKLIDLARIILTRRFPILIEGPTSSGKTSSVEYLAKRTGHQFIRINNHEHTDIQEYIGSYVSDPQTGKLVFKDGLLVRALRDGDWIVLDELNLAPTDVLEALNRLLDDNRELVIPETQEVVKPHPHFMLFATQNPPGLYAGRKVLSRAFRNRFLEVHFEDVPQVELETILCQRCRIAPSYGKRIVSVFHELQKRRQSSRVFESKQGFATLRDLFRWAGRDAVGYQELAENGYMLLAERARRDDDKVAVKEVIESIMNVKIDEAAIYNIHNPNLDMASFLGCPLPTTSDVIWTSAMQRLFVLVSRALRFNEPVLLVGETGSGKTSVCQVFADATSQRLHGLNCHQNTETADLIGGLRPVRNRSTREADVLREAIEMLRDIGVHDLPSSFDELPAVLNKALKSNTHFLPGHQSRIRHVQKKLSQLQSIFEWHDGPLVEAMRNGDVFLLDEISLADDSVLERLNSVLEPGRSIVLAEKGGGNDQAHPAIRADANFKLVATMNPGGDYGKKELSPALRNRFTEIWVPRVEDHHDLELIVGSLWKCNDLQRYTTGVLEFTEWLCDQVGDHSLMSLRDILAWVVFTNSAYHPESPDCIPPDEIFHHAAHMTFLDGLASLPQLSSYSREGLQQLKDDALSKLMDIVPLSDRDSLFTFIPSHDASTSIQIGSFTIPRGPKESATHTFNLQAPTTLDNAMRVVRACQVPKPILLEGSPGVGKTSLVTALANISGHELCRINLSDQTDLIDLFGSDLPVEGGGAGEFAWKDAEFLKALQEGHWVLLDEMNLAPQAVLEGLNAVLDHRGAVYIPELGRSFIRHPSFRIFAAQNPLSQGGGRKGLPKSFVNRFTKVYVEELTPGDLLMVCRHIFPDFDETIVQSMISYNMSLHEAVGIQRKFAREGSPWEFNLRDVIRWGALLRTPGQPLHPTEHLRTVYLHRFRSEEDRNQARLLFDQVFSASTKSWDDSPHITLSSSHLQVGHFLTQRKNRVALFPAGRILKMQLPALESIGHCVSQAWLAILTGQRNSGKTDVVRVLAHYTGNTLQEISMNSATDTMDILGSFEQADFRGRALALIDDTLFLLDDYLRSTPGSKFSQDHIYSLRKARSSANSIEPLLRAASELLASLPQSQLGMTTLGKMHDLLSMPDTAGRFEWVDGPLVQAMKLGHWLLMDGANLCNPSVLDRLNSLCEQDGFLTLSERGYVEGKVQVLRPHPNFRLFMTVDPQYGELSRAMRNRGIEISLVATPIADDWSIISDFQRLPRSTGTHSDPQYRPFLFDAIRRGLLSQGGKASLILSSSGRALDQESGLSTLVDQAPLILTSVGDTRIADAHLAFLARTMVPAYIPYLARYLASTFPSLDPSFSRIQNLINKLPGRSLTTILTRFRKMYALSLALPPDFVLTQPMDFYLNAPSCIDKNLEFNSPSTHHTLVRALDLAVALFVDDEDREQIDSQGTSLFQQDPKKTKTIEAIMSVLTAIHSVGRTILDALSAIEKVSRLGDLAIASNLLNYSRYLHKALGAGSIDFSALQAICRWIAEAIENSSSSFDTVATQMRGLHDAVSLSSGLGMIEIWSNLFVERPPTISGLENIDAYSACLNGKEAPRIRRQAFDLMSLKTIPVNLSGSAETALLDLKSDLESYLMPHHTQEQKDLNVDPSLIISELEIFLALFDPEVAVGRVQEIIHLSCSTRGPMLRMVSYQHLLWSIQAKKDTIPIIAQMQIQWLDGLWNTDDIFNGPSILLQPIQLIRTIGACDWTQNPLCSVDDYDEEIHRHLRLVLLQCEQTTGRVGKLVSFLRQSIVLITASFASSFPADHYELIQGLVSHPEAGISDGMNTLLTHLELSTSAPFKRAIQTHLRPSIQRFQERSSRECTITDLGFCWIAVGNLILELFIPDTPVDPAAIQNCTTERLSQEEETLLSQIRLHRKLEELTTGNTRNELLDHLETLLSSVSQRFRSAPPLPIRNDVSRLHMFWSEVSQFQKHVLSPAKTEELLARLESGDENALARERLIQQSIAGFCQRMDTVYVEYSDLNTPIKLAVLHLRMGLRLVAHSTISKLHDSDTVLASHTASALVAFPSVRSSAGLYPDSGKAPSAITPFSRLLLTVSAIAMERSIGVSTRLQTDTLELANGQALRLWLIDRAKESEADLAANSLYRHKNEDHDDIGEAQMEEQEFLSLFPSFENALDPDAQTTSVQKPSHTPLLVPRSEMALFVAIHKSLSGGTSVSASVTSFQEIRNSALMSLLSSNSLSLPDTLDNESIALQFSLLYDRIVKLEAAPMAGENAYNFYTDANVLEVKKAALVVSALKDRLEDVINDWPDQMVLQHLRSRCDVVLGLDLHSPVAKILSALEQLLLQTEDWEIYANRENTLKLNQQSLIELIVEWRRLELACWQVLLESQSTTFEQGVSEWWFRLYDATLRGPLDARDREENGSLEGLEQYLDSLIPLLDDFIRTSPLGEFHARMGLLQSFEAYIHHLSSCKSGYEWTTLNRIRRILNSTGGYYALFSQKISSHLSEQRTILEKEIRGFIKLASWKDINVQALKASAQRTHHQLYKIIRKFRDVLRQPILDHLHPQQADVAETKHLHLENVPAASAIFQSSLPESEARTSSSNHLLNLSRTLTKFDSLITGRIRSFIHAKSAHIVDHLAVDIIVMTKELAAISLPSDLPAEKRGKQRKALLVRKRKAWSDLLKELKHAGFAVNIKPEVLRQNADTRWLREQPIMPSVAEPAMSTQKGENYFLQLCGSLPALRSTVSNHHSDLTTRELQRGVTLLESGFSIGIDLRSRLTASLEKYRNLEQMTARMQMLSSCPQVLHSGFDILDHVTSIKNTLCKLSSALHELNDGVEKHKAMEPRTKVTEFLVQEIRNTETSTAVLRDRFAIILENMKLTSMPILLQSEHKALIEARRHVSEILSNLRRWAESAPKLRYLFCPVEQWLDLQELSPSLPPHTNITASDDTIDILINAFLVTVQNLVGKCPETTPTPQEDENDQYILQDHRIVREFTHLLNLDPIMASLDKVLLHMVAHPESLQLNIQRVLPFLHVYLGLVKDQLANHSQWVKAMFKLDFVLCSVMHTLATQGFCQPPESDEKEAGGDASETVDGVGLGQGSGTDNVSKEIEEESQVEGLKGDDAEGQEPRDEKGDADAIEMNEDFGGELEDVPDTGSQDDAGSDHESDVDAEEQLGNLDPTDPAAVDEKMWGDEKGPEDDRQEEKMDQDRSEEKSGDSEVVAKEGKDKSQSKEKKSEEKKESAEETAVDGEDEPMEPEEDGEGPNASGAPMEDYVQDANTLDLPDNIDLGGDDMELGDEELPEDMVGEEDDSLEEQMDNGEPETGPDDSPPDQWAQEDHPPEDIPEPDQEHDSEVPSQAQESPDDETALDGENPEEDASKEDAVARPDVSAGEGTASTEEVQNPDGGESAATGQAGSAEGIEGKDTASQDKAIDQDGSPEMRKPPPEAQNADSDAAGSAATGTQEGQLPSQPDGQSSTNPLRSLGDALKEIRQRFDDIIYGEQRDTPRDQAGAADTADQMEYLQPDDADHDMQALGPAGEEQVAKLNELKLIDGGDQNGDIAPMDVDLPPDVEDHERPSSDPASQAELTSTEQRNDIEGAILQTARPATHQAALSSDPSTSKPDVDMEETTEQIVEAELRDWQTRGFPDAGAERIWRLYESLTHDLAYALCEQLRLILDPTLATRLKGDYRTGKRLNMKKIISYIASDYTKDKIWLRRTRPSQREYQVLIAIDDSRSMAESHSVHLAYETLALVSKALGRLEAGDIAVAKFGESVDLLHGFDEGPFTDQSGMKVMSAFHFNQKATNVLSLVETSLKVLERARERRAMSSATAADLWQLEFIISDGMCQDHERLRTVLRKAEEQRVMIVFVIIDSLHTTTGNVTSSAGGQQSAHQGSILTMDKAEFKNVDGRMELQLQKYLNSFPFEYYVVLRNVEALPEVLASTLKQFFERISEE
ncbi:Midasin [Hypsizygus marmoreus]|uniref:Midasin n=1 Tax=Hypsizygus marmoreus TaxID=39966 RepID=A0A369J5I4_HYPMA|nr:Midasin [Hypsizygus marmoreus]